MYKYELHCHTNVSSKCGIISPEDLVDFYKSLDYTGIVITDHFFNGNCSVPKDLPWKERIKLFVKSYKEAKKRGDEVGLDVFFGFEASDKGNDFLVYGIDEKQLKNFCCCDKIPINDFLKLMREKGGYVVHAHPFREADYIPCIKLLPRDVDGVEVINANRTQFENEMARQYALNYDIAMFCGSDNHGKNTKLACTEIDFRATTVKEIIEAGLRGNIKNTLKEL